MQHYANVWQQMKDFTAKRDQQTIDEVWLLEHFSIYTQGQAGKAEHIIKHNNIDIIQSDRGGQITYHGPGQLIAYVLLDINRRRLGVKTLVCLLENILIDILATYNIQAQTICGAPGVYVEQAKIASIGLRVKNGYTFHGIALNVNLDLAPFNDINPCGFKKLKILFFPSFPES